MKIRDRITELRRVPANQLKPNPRNWRTHPAQQRNVMRGLLAEIGYADALLARVLGDGSLELIDGHLRAETTPDALVPVLVLDVSEEEAHKILLSIDPVAGMAETASDELESLLAEVEFQNGATRRMVEELLATPEQALDESANTIHSEGADLTAQTSREIDIPEFYQVVVECHDEADQHRVYEQMRAAGYRCRVLTL